MKNIIYLLFWCCPLVVTAQQSISGESAVPRAGDEIIKQELARFEPGQAGAGLTWDLSRVQPLEKEYPVAYFNLYGQLTGAEGNRLNTYRFSGDSLLLLKQESASGIVRYHTPQLLIKFPLVYGSSNQSLVWGKGRYYDKMEIRSTGTIDSRVDGTGQLILPGGDTLTDVFRVHIAKKLTECYSPLPVRFDIEEAGITQAGETVDSLLIETGTYLWYARGYRYPVMEITEEQVLTKDGVVHQSYTALLCHPSEQAYIPMDEENDFLRSQKQLPAQTTGIDDIKPTPEVSIYPNPVKNILYLSFALEKETAVKISLYDMQGKEIHRSDKQTRAGHITEQLNLSNYPKGSYLLRLQIGDKQVNEKIVKQ